MKKLIFGLLCCLGLSVVLLGNPDVLTNTASSIPITSSTYSCYPASGAVFPTAGVLGCTTSNQSGSAATVAATYTNFTVSISTPVPVGQSLRVDLGNFTSSPTQAMACTISAGATSCSAVAPAGPAFTASVGDILSVNFNNSTGTQSFIIPKATWTIQ